MRGSVESAINGSVVVLWLCFPTRVMVVEVEWSIMAVLGGRVGKRWTGEILESGHGEGESVVSAAVAEFVGRIIQDNAGCILPIPQPGCIHVVYLVQSNDTRQATT